ncbi:MAG: hypothetical protein LBR31_07725, partial [Desulfovibrio sp.]|nr:hypothetical protein [Desulfovibrio sp.]
SPFNKLKTNVIRRLAVRRWIASSLPVVSITTSCQIMAYGCNFQGGQYSHTLSKIPIPEKV